MKENFSYKFVDFLISVHQVTDELIKEYKPEDLTPIQFKIMQYIGVNHPVTLSELSDCLQISMPNTSRELKKLIEKGLCEKTVDVEDRRKQYIRLSEKGKTIINEAFASIENRFHDRIKNLSEKGIEEVRQALKVLHDKVFDSDL